MTHKTHAPGLVVLGGDRSAPWTTTAPRAGAKASGSHTPSARGAPPRR